MLVGGQISSGGGHGRKVAISILSVCGIKYSGAPYISIMAILAAQCENIVPAQGLILELKSAVSALMRAAKSVQMGGYG